MENSERLEYLEGDSHPEIHRGECWVISERPLYPGLLGLERTGVVLTDEWWISKLDFVHMVLCSTSSARRGSLTHVWFESGRRRMVAVCNNILCVPKPWLRVNNGVIAPDVMRKIDLGVARIFGLGKLVAAGFAPAAVPADDSLLDLNTATVEQLVSAGWSDRNINGILQGRPFSSWSNVVSCLRLTPTAAGQMAETCTVIWTGWQNRLDAPDAVDDPVDADPPEEAAPPPEKTACPEPVDLYRLTLKETKAFFGEQGFRPSQIQGLRSGLYRYRIVNGVPARSVSELPVNARLTKRTLARLLLLEERGVICLGSDGTD